jgi:hypothetical protein
MSAKKNIHENVCHGVKNAEFYAKNKKVYLKILSTKN